MTSTIDTVDGVEFEYVGKTLPAFIFVHGGFCDRNHWRAQADGLAERHKVVTLDLPGHGKSIGVDSISVDYLAEMVLKVQQRCAVGTAILVGHGFGCSVIVEAYNRMPSAVIGMVLIEGHPLAPTIRHSVPTSGQGGEAVREATLRLFDSGFLPDTASARREQMLSDIAGIDKEFIAQLYRCLVDWQPKVPSILPRIKVPLLLLESTVLREGLFRPSRKGESADWTQTVERLSPNVLKSHIEGTGHFSPIKAADRVNQHLIDFASYCVRS